MAGVLALVVWFCVGSAPTPRAIDLGGPDPLHPAVEPAEGSPVLIGAGDICVTPQLANAQATAALIAARSSDIVFTLGDNSNENGTFGEFSNCYDKAWGAFRYRTHPVIGNHEYGVPGAAGYFSYFGVAAGPAGRGWYSYDLANNWHVIVLNSMCPEAGGCTVGSPQEKFLRDDLAAHEGKHIIAMWHIPPFSSGNLHGNNTTYTPWLQDLYDAHADIVMGGHDHDYERFALQSPVGVTDPNGIRAFVVGTGGAKQRAMWVAQPNSRARSAGVFGVLELTLGAHSYSWKFIPVAGQTFTDSGTQATHS